MRTPEEEVRYNREYYKKNRIKQNELAKRWKRRKRKEFYEHGLTCSGKPRVRNTRRWRKISNLLATKEGVNCQRCEILLTSSFAGKHNGFFCEECRTQAVGLVNKK